MDKNSQRSKGTYEELSVAFEKLLDDYVTTKYPKRETPLAPQTAPATPPTKSSLRVLA